MPPGRNPGAFPNSGSIGPEPFPSREFPNPGRKWGVSGAFQAPGLQSVQI